MADERDKVRQVILSMIKEIDSSIWDRTYDNNETITYELWDSLSLVTFLVALEERFDICITIEKINDMTITQLIDEILKYNAQQSHKVY